MFLGIDYYNHHQCHNHLPNHHYNNKIYRLKDSLVTARPKNKYKILLGSAYKNDDYNMVFTNETKNKFLVKKINSITKETSQKEFEIKSKKGFFVLIVTGVRAF